MRWHAEQVSMQVGPGALARRVYTGGHGLAGAAWRIDTGSRGLARAARRADI